MNKFLGLLFAATILWGMLSCDDESQLGKTVIPNSDAFEVDSLSYTNFIVNTLSDDSLTNSTRAVNVLLGEQFSSIFGQGLATYFTELAYSKFDNVSNPVIDSAVIYLKTASFEGDSTTVQSFDIFTLQDSIPSNDTLPITHNFSTNEKVGNLTDVRFSSKKMTINGDSTKSGYIKGVIDNAYVQTILNKLNDSSIQNNQQLQTFAKGLAIKPVGNKTGEGLFNVSTNDATTGIHVYYHDENDSTYNYKIGFGVALDRETTDGKFAGVYNFNQLSNQYSLGDNDIQNLISNYSTTGQTNAYINGLMGTVAELKFEDAVSNLTEVERINEAELELNIDLTSQLKDTLFLPNQLVLFESYVRDDNNLKTGNIIGIDGNGLSVRQPNRTYDKSRIGFRQKKSTGKYTYTFYLPNYLEAVKNNQLPAKLYIGTSNRLTSFDGCQFDVSNTNNSNIKLNIKYSKKN